MKQTDKCEKCLEYEKFIKSITDDTFIRLDKNTYNLFKEFIKSHSQSLPEQLDKSVRASEEEKSLSRNKDSTSSVLYTPLTYKFKTYSGLEVVNYKELVSALNGLREDVNKLKCEDDFYTEGIRNGVLDKLNKWFPILDDEVK